MVYTRCYRDGRLCQEGFAIADVSEHLRDPRSTVWFDLCRPHAKELETIREELSLHELAVEDVLQPGQRPKVDHYPEHLFLVVYALGLDQETKRLATYDVGVFATKNAMVTVRSDEGFDIEQVMSRWDDTAHLAGNGVSFLLHGLLDYVVDTQFEAVQRLDSDIDALEDQLFNDVGTDAQVQRQNFELRKSLVQLRRLVLPMREVVNTLMRRDLDIVSSEMAPYFQDVYDHVLRVTEWTESLRDLVSNILETRLIIRGNQLNTIMKKVTSWAAIIAVPTAVTGYFGQNLPYPGFQQMWGFWLSLSIIAVASVGLYITFKARDWL